MCPFYANELLQPVDCLRLGALEMHESPEVAIIQHASGVMQVVHNLFENASKSKIRMDGENSIFDKTNAILVTYFTEVIYTSIQFAVGCGDVGPVSVDLCAQRSG